jgi:hypothetical protein
MEVIGCARIAQADGQEWLDHELEPADHQKHEEGDVERTAAPRAKHHCSAQHMGSEIGELIGHGPAKRCAGGLIGKHGVDPERNYPDQPNGSPWRGDIVVAGKPDDAGEERPQRHGEHDDVEQERIGLERQDELKSGVQHADRIGDGQPASADRGAVMPRQGAECRGKQTRDKDIDGENEASSAQQTELMS